MEFISDHKTVDLLSSNDPKRPQDLLLRFAWSFFSFLIFSAPGRRFSQFRVLILRIFGAKIGEKVLICSGVHVWFPWNLEIGDCSAIGRSVEIYNYGRVTIGSNTVISQYSYLCTASHDYNSRSFDFFAKPIVIGNFAWIAAYTLLLPGVCVGDGSVIGARSLVTKNVSPWMVYAGHPCAPIKPREIHSI